VVHRHDGSSCIENSGMMSVYDIVYRYLNRLDVKGQGQIVIKCEEKSVLLLGQNAVLFY